MTRFKAWLIKKRFMLSERCRVFTYRFDGRKYITVVKIGLNGQESIRRFEVKDELDDNMNPIQFKGKEAIRFPAVAGSAKPAAKDDAASTAILAQAIMRGVKAAMKSTIQNHSTTDDSSEA